MTLAPVEATHLNAPAGQWLDLPEPEANNARNGVRGPSKPPEPWWPAHLADIPLEQRWLTRKQAALYCQVNVATISRAVSSKRLTCSKVTPGSPPRFRIAWLDEWQESWVYERTAR